MFKSLKLKLLFYFFLTNLVVLLGFSIFIYTTAQKGVSDTLDTMLKIISIDAIPDLKAREYVNAKEISGELIDEFSITPLHIKIIYFDKNTNKIKYQTISSTEQSKLFELPLNEKGHLHSIYYFDKDIYRVSSMVLFEDEEIKIFFQLATEKILNSPYLNKIVTSLLIANPIILILFLFIAHILINRTLQPVKNVVDSVHSISANKLSHRISSDNIPTEIRELVDTFNELLKNLEESFNRISAFSSDASHELKTPLTVIRGEIEVALRQERTPVEYKAVLDDLLLETVRVQETIDQLFLITKKDTAELNGNTQEVYLDEIITDVVSQINKFASKKSIHVKIKEMVPATIHANEALIKIAIDNILRNAIIYSNESSEVNLSIKESGKDYILEIEDSGCGIDEEDLPFIFERFYRADKSRSRKESGTGLGLAIVKMILDIHHYDILIKSHINKGTRVIITIPKE